MRARMSTIGLKAGWVVTSGTRSPSIHTSRPSRIDSRYSSPVLIMPMHRGGCDGIGQIGLTPAVSSDLTMPDPAARFTLRQLSCFVAACEGGGIGAAAGRLQLAQATVSAAIADLERTLGVQLLVRGSRRAAAPSPAGRELLAAAVEVLAAAGRLDERSAALRGDVSGELPVGCLVTLAPVAAPRACRAFEQRWPRARVRLLPGDQGELLARLRDGTVAVAITYDLGLDDQVEFRAARAGAALRPRRGRPPARRRPHADARRPGRRAARPARPAVVARVLPRALPHGGRRAPDLAPGGRPGAGAKPRRMGLRLHARQRPPGADPGRRRDTASGHPAARPRPRAQRRPRPPRRARADAERRRVRRGVRGASRSAAPLRLTRYGDAAGRDRNDIRGRPGDVRARREGGPAGASASRRSRPTRCRRGSRICPGRLLQRQTGAGWAALRDLPPPGAGLDPDGARGRCGLRAHGRARRPRIDRSAAGSGARPVRAGRRAGAAAAARADRGRAAPGRAGGGDDRGGGAGGGGARLRAAPRPDAARRPGRRGRNRASRRRGRACAATGSRSAARCSRCSPRRPRA